MTELIQQPHFIVDPSWRRPDRGLMVFAGSPLKMFTLSEQGRQIAELLEIGLPLPVGHETLTSRLLDAGAIHPTHIVGSEQPFTLADVSIVIPAFVRNAKDARLLGTLVSTLTNWATSVSTIIVVDDASPVALPELSGARVVSLEINKGPGAARNHGLHFVTTPFVAFVDVDVTLESNTLDELLVYFSDEQVGMVAPRIMCATSEGVLSAYESVRSPLDLGATEGRIRKGTRISYTPSAMWLCRTEAMREINGFDETLQVGEDVDALWRLDSAGWRCRYQPNAQCTHLPRSTVNDFVGQRIGYGTSAAALAKRHNGALAPVRISGYSAGMWALVALGYPIFGALVGIGTIAALARKLRDVPHAVEESVRLAGLGNLHAGRTIASAITRVWWPIAVVLALFSKRMRWVLISAAVVPSMYEWWKSRPQLDPIRFTALRVLDDAAYGVGVWKGVVREQNFEALKPDLTSWPKNAN
jgi:mycofactocin system glycosyltransferase